MQYRKRVTTMKTPKDIQDNVETVKGILMGIAFGFGIFLVLLLISLI